MSNRNTLIPMVSALLSAAMLGERVLGATVEITVEVSFPAKAAGSCLSVALLDATKRDPPVLIQRQNLDPIGKSPVKVLFSITDKPNIETVRAEATITGMANYIPLPGESDMPLEGNATIHIQFTEAHEEKCVAVTCRWLDPCTQTWHSRTVVCCRQPDPQPTPRDAVASRRDGFSLRRTVQPHSHRVEVTRLVQPRRRGVEIPRITRRDESPEPIRPVILWAGQ